jgi:hypothetical protein
MLGNISRVSLVLEFEAYGSCNPSITYGLLVFGRGVGFVAVDCDGRKKN